MLQSRLTELNKWQDRERLAITKAIDDENARLDRLMQKEETTVKKNETVQAVNVFKKMSLGTNSEIVSDLWWLLAFLVAQLFTVLAAPKADEDQQTRHRRTRKPKAEAENWSELVWWWVWAHWVCVRTGKPHQLLDRASFDTFVTAHYRALTDSQYQRIAQSASSEGVTAGEEIREENEETARRRILEKIT